MYVFRTTVTGKIRYEVGFYDPDGQFVVANDFEYQRNAEKYVNYLNGGNGNDWDDPEEEI